MSSLKILAAFAVVTCTVAGCMNSPEALKRETAKSIGGSVSPDDVTLSDVDRGMTEVKWIATVPKGTYRCSGDDMLHSVYCAKK